LLDPLFDPFRREVGGHGEDGNGGCDTAAFDQTFFEDHSLQYQQEKQPSHPPTDRSPRERPGDRLSRQSTEKEEHSLSQKPTREEKDNQNSLPDVQSRLSVPGRRRFVARAH
jgi:hypothetical protein